MSQHFPKVQARRELLADAARYVALGLLGGLGGSILAQKRKIVRQSGCVNRGLCGCCDVFQKCALPQALRAKEVSSRVNHGQR